MGNSKATPGKRVGYALCILIAAAICPSGNADEVPGVCKRVDPVTGEIEYFNPDAKRWKSCTGIEDRLSTVGTGNKPTKGKAAAAATPRTVGTSSNNSAGATAAVVDAGTQKTRDGTRRQVLSDELSSEEKALAETRAAFNNGKPLPLADEGVGSPKYIDRAKQLEQTLRHHERNVAALKQELSNLKL